MDHLDPPAYQPSALVSHLKSWANNSQATREIALWIVALAAAIVCLIDLGRGLWPPDHVVVQAPTATCRNVNYIAGSDAPNTEDPDYRPLLRVVDARDLAGPHPLCVSNAADPSQNVSDWASPPTFWAYQAMGLPWFEVLLGAAVGFWSVPVLLHRWWRRLDQRHRATFDTWRAGQIAAAQSRPYALLIAQTQLQQPRARPRRRVPGLTIRYGAFAAIDAPPRTMLFDVKDNNVTWEHCDSSGRTVRFPEASYDAADGRLVAGSRAVIMSPDNDLHLPIYQPPQSDPGWLEGWLATYRPNDHDH